MQPPQGEEVGRAPRTTHRALQASANDLGALANASIDLVLTSPPYPMVQMWDECFARQDPAITQALNSAPTEACERMHRLLDRAWQECHRVLKPGGHLCINIGNATRSIGGRFALYDNASRVAEACRQLALTQLPGIVWRKATNAPNKFLGSGTLPCGAYCTLEHEWILIFRKEPRRTFDTDRARRLRQRSAYFWEERNVWYSDLWELPGARQQMAAELGRERSAAFPMELPWRLVNMYSVQGDTVLDPFLGTGTTMQAAAALGRNSVGCDIEPNLTQAALEGVAKLCGAAGNRLTQRRIDRHRAFVAQRAEQGLECKYHNEWLGAPVVTKAEEAIRFDRLGPARRLDELTLEVLHIPTDHAPTTTSEP